MLDAGDIQLLKTYGQGPYAGQLKRIEKEIEDIRKRVNEKMGVKESETGLAPPNLVSCNEPGPIQLTATRKLTFHVSKWDIPADKQRMGEEHPLQVARCTKIIPGSISLAAAAAAAAQASSQAANGTAQNGEANGSSSSSSPPAQPPAAGGGRAGGMGGLGGLAGALGGGGGADRRPNADEEDKYVINVKQIAKFVVGLGDKVASTDIEEGMRVG